MEKDIRNQAEETSKVTEYLNTIVKNKHINTEINYTTYKPLSGHTDHYKPLMTYTAETGSNTSKKEILLEMCGENDIRKITVNTLDN